MTGGAFDLGFPGDYLRLPLHLLDDEDQAAVDAGHAALRDAIEARLADDDPRLASTSDELLPVLWAFTLEAWEFGAVAAAVQVLDLPEGRYTAAVRVYHEDLPGPAQAGGDRPKAHAKALARRLQEPRPGDVSSRAVDVVSLPGGLAVRVSYRADDEGRAQAPSTLSVVLEVLEHWFPIEGTSRALVVEGRTSFLTEAAGMVEDLDRIADSVRLYAP